MNIQFQYKMFWYEYGDQLLMLGRESLYYLTSDWSAFANGATPDADSVEIRGVIRRIHHPELGEIEALITIGLDYVIVLADGRKVTVNAEESPGEVYDYDQPVYGWTFAVEVEVLEITGRTLVHLHGKKTYQSYLARKASNAQLKTELRSKYGVEVDL